ncbi:hypothetical protein LCGC14_2569110 [marine sediment metagenome]|uniref:Uncharacterized protein n=1 Tax=marine sediment metagenome TaxID=412755 RepID=A0A0F9DAL4_9ZZZZ
MATLAELKGSEVKLRESLSKERVPEFVEDVAWAYKFVKARRRLVERKIGMRKITW